jgi:ABC-2 type transport system ATP-binding protein
MMLEVNDLKKTFGSHVAVNGVGFALTKGEVYGLLGPNGAGKSTTMAMICGLLKPDSGTIRIRGEDVRKKGRSAQQYLGIVPQETALYTNLSAEENLRFWAVLNGVPQKEVKGAVEHVLQLVGLAERKKGKVAKFSGGMKRRLNIAAGLIHQPELLIMDEPTVGIDPQSRHHILETVRRLKEDGMTVLYTSHYVEEVEYLCDRVGIMDNGSMIAEGSVGQLLAQGPRHQELTMTLDSISSEMEASVRALPGVEKAVPMERVLNIVTQNAEQILPMAFETIIRLGGSVTEIKIQKPNLESLFLSLTGKALRDS